LVVSASSDPDVSNPIPKRTKRAYGEILQHWRRSVRREDEPIGGYDRSVRGSIAAAPWEENAHARDSKK